MADTGTTYMGIPLRNPLIVGASALTSSVKSIQQIEAMGAGAVVTKSLFEEQIELERFKLDEDIHKFDSRHAEMLTFFPNLSHAGPRDHIQWLREVRDAVSIPVIASLNAVHRDTWLEYAEKLAATGVNGLECNFFASPRDIDRTGGAVEEEQIELVQCLSRASPLPVSFKLSHFYSNPSNVIRRMDRAGARAFVLFNRLLEPDIDVEAEKNTCPFNLSHETDYRLPLRYAGLLEGEIEADICCSTGISSGKDVVKMILAGARTVQVVTALFRGGIGYLRAMLDDVERWMEQKGYGSPDAFRGKLSRRHSPDPWAYTRAQYARLLMNPEEIVRNYPVL
jgi:dihydroorotate dehydrogenase (fumarate)